ncbi:hypothetical protein B7494_g2910 [Chlorociboria aeruginascens]|nr:hypothetical protein B7494_g2910 [Chlorociboria aeruginascens]
MATPSRPSTSDTYQQNTTSNSQTTYGRRPGTARPKIARPSTGCRSRAASTIGGIENQQIVCAISESRGVTPTVGLAFVNLSTNEAVVSQISDNQFYARTVNKLQVFEPTIILIVSTSGPPNAKSNMYQVIEENVVGARIITVDRKYWSESAGLEYVQQLAFVADAEALKVAIGGNYFATCCFSAVMKYIELSMSMTIVFHSLRVKFQPSEGSMMIDLSTIHSLELIQNIQDAKSNQCLFGIMNETSTPMGSRLLRSNILQPSTQPDVLTQRYDAVQEFTEKEDMFVQTRQALTPFLDVEKLLTSLIIIPSFPDVTYTEQSINNILMLKNFIQSIKPVFESLAGARSNLLIMIRDNCRSQKIEPAMHLISKSINDDATYQTRALDLRNQRTYASGVNGLLDVARQTFKEATADVHQHISDINQKYEMQAETKFETSRKYWLKISENDFDGREVPDIFINRFLKKGYMECQTLDLVKLNQRIEDSHHEVVLMSDKTIQVLLDEIRAEIPILFKVCESIAMLDLITSFTQISTKNGQYCRPEMLDSLTIEHGRHPIREKFSAKEFVPNTVMATSDKRFHIITGCNMSGKSTYIRTIALITVMAQVGCFVPATNIDKHSIAIIDELGRGTSTRDGLAISLSIAEALVESQAFVWFATHFRELVIMAKRIGVINHHLAVDMSSNAMSMLYKLTDGYVEEEHYGLAMARVIDLPPEIIKVAEKVSKTLVVRAEANKSSRKAAALMERRKIILELKNWLIDAENSRMEDNALIGWLNRLQELFVQRMEKIEHDAASDYTDEEDNNNQDERDDVKEELRDRTSVSGSFVDSQEE